MDVDVIGITSLLCHNFSDPTKQTILDKQMGKANKARATRDPLSDFVESIYYLNGTDKSVLLGELKNKKCWVGDNVADVFKDIPIGIKGGAFKNAAVRAGKSVNLDMTAARSAFFILDDYVEVKYNELIIKQDNVNVGQKKPDLRFRAELKNWRATLKVVVNLSVLSLEQVCNIINRSGYYPGVGDWRPESKGTHGMFKIKASDN